MTNAVTELCHLLGEEMRQRRACLMTVESCTGGGIAHAVTSVAGSSDWFDRALVTYSNAAKTELAGVDASLIVRHGAVSEPVAAGMATGALKKNIVSCPLALAVSVTGVAGPGGGTPEKPVGMVCFGWAGMRDGAITLYQTQTRRFEGDRLQVRQESVHHALETMLQLITADRV